ncbi:hypothetical protein RO218_000467 [Salmonella enterica]|nr:hypothetical protein [Salmonella enterica]EII5191889.1 hypothetical protein [Salmonella enterica]EJI8813255.1 hypothetical protein [Salmonella enterica]ELH3126673.1 hypothetical protein [Salmonella enterica]ELT9143478.1 hypothetical protein [Salmonella enterica]
MTIMAQSTFTGLRIGQGASFCLVDVIAVFADDTDDPGTEVIPRTYRLHKNCSDLMIRQLQYVSAAS